MADSINDPLASVIEGLLPFLNLLTPLLVLTGGVVALKGIFDMQRGGYGASGRIASGVMIGGLGVGLPLSIRAFGPALGVDLPEASKDTDGAGSDSRPANDPTPTADPTTDTGGTDSTGGDSPLDPAGFETFLLVIGCIMAVVVLIGLIAGGVAYARSRKRKAVEAREAAARAKAEEEARLDRVWAEAVERHDHVRDEMMRHQSDIDLVLSMPAINDQHDEKTAAFTEALAKAADLAHDTRPSSAEAVEAYAAATRAAERAWGAAWRNADRIRLSKFSSEEQTRIKQVIKLMKRAEFETTPEARATYYRKAMQDLGHLIEIPAPAAEAIEQRIAGVLANPNADPQVTTYDAPTSLDASILSTLARKARQKVTR